MLIIKLFNAFYLTKSNNPNLWLDVLMVVNWH